MKYWVCKRAPQHAIEALECLGGNGYVEESGMPRLYRDSPLNSIWEGSGNVAALDVLRAMVREPEGLPAFLAECELARGANAALDAHLDRLQAAPADPEFEARRVVEDLALALQASLLVRHAPPAVGDAFCAGRLGDGGRVFGTLPARAPTRARSSSARSRREHADLRGRRARRPHHARPARARQRHHARHARRAGRGRRAGEPRPAGARDRARRQRQGLLRRLRPGGVGRGLRRRRTRPARRSTRRPSRRTTTPSPLGPGGRLADDEPQPARLHVAVPLRQARGVQGARLLRGRRHRHGALLRPAGDRRRRPHRLPPRPRLGRAHLRAVGRSGWATSAPSACCSPAT